MTSPDPIELTDIIPAKLADPLAGVVVRHLTVRPDDRGWLLEIMRCDDTHFRGFGQVYMSATYPGVVKAWHHHRIQTDSFVCLRGMVKLVLIDFRVASRTYGYLNEFWLGDLNPALVQIPPFVWHGWKCVSQEPSLVVNVVTHPYNYDNPDEQRDTPHSLWYDWSRKDG